MFSIQPTGSYRLLFFTIVLLIRGTVTVLALISFDSFDILILFIPFTLWLIFFSQKHSDTKSFMTVNLDQVHARLVIWQCGRLIHAHRIIPVLTIWCLIRQPQLALISQLWHYIPFSSSKFKLSQQSILLIIILEALHLQP